MVSGLHPPHPRVTSDLTPDFHLFIRTHRSGRVWLRDVCFLLVAFAVGVHPAPSRTRSLSPPAPMVPEASASGRVGRCQPPQLTPPSNATSA